VGLGLCGFTVLCAITSVVLALAAALANDPKISFRGPFAELIGLPSTHGDHVYFRAFTGVFALVGINTGISSVALHFLTGVLLLQMVKFWLSFLENMNTQSSREQHTYRILTILTNETISYGGNIISAFILVGLIVLIVGMFGTLTLYGSFSFVTYLFLPSIVAVTMCVVIGFFPQAGQMYTRTTVLRKNWENSSDKYLRAFGRSCRPLRLSATPFFIIKSTTIVTFMNIALDRLIDLLISY